MAITSSVSDWTSGNVSKTLSIQSALTSKLRVYKIKCTCGGSDTYATNGVSVSDIKQGRITTLVSVITETSSLAYKADFDKTNSKIKLYTVGGSAGALFVELANATSIASATFEFLVIGY